MHDHGPEQDPAEPIEGERRDRHGKQRRHALLSAQHRDETAQHDELALANIDDVGDSPDQRHAVSGKCEHGADQDAVDEELEPERRRLEQNEEIGNHVPRAMRPRMRLSPTLMLTKREARRRPLSKQRYGSGRGTIGVPAAHLGG